MAIHHSIPSMLKESLTEMFLVAKYCINFRKDSKTWGSDGCYGYPAVILLLLIVDTIGSYVIGGTTREHFDILNNKDYYNLNLKKHEIDLIYERYRNLLIHNGVLAIDVYLDIGNECKPVYEIRKEEPFKGKPSINLIPFLLFTEKAIKKFLEKKDAIVNKSQQLEKIKNLSDKPYIKQKKLKI